MKKIIITFMVLTTIILASCGNPTITDIEDETVVIEVPSFKSVEEGDYDSLYSEVSVLSFETQEFLKGEEPSYTWKSSNPDIAVVDNDGIVTPLKGGTVTITILLNNDIEKGSVDLTFNDVRLITGSPWTKSEFGDSYTFYSDGTFFYNSNGWGDQYGFWSTKTIDEKVWLVLGSVKIDLSTWEYVSE